MATCECGVTLKDSNGVSHYVTVKADSLYEAAALALAQFRRSGVVSAAAGSGAALSVYIYNPHNRSAEVKIANLESWLKRTAGKSPAEAIRRQRVKEILGGQESEGRKA